MIDAALDELRHLSVVDGGRVTDILLDLRNEARTANIIGELWAAQAGVILPGLSD